MTETERKLLQQRLRKLYGHALRSAANCRLIDDKRRAEGRAAAYLKALELIGGVRKR